jgi:hypothetical protein
MELCAVVELTASLFHCLACLERLRPKSNHVPGNRLSDMPFVNIAGPCKGGSWRKRET